MIDFFIAGVQKAGTTALHEMLSPHSQIAMSTKKELHLFDRERDELSLELASAVEPYFKGALPDAIRGEATPIYTYWPDAVGRIAQYNPQSRIIVIFRHPAYRAFSHWKMETLRGKETLPFSDAIRERGRRRVKAAPGGVHRIHSYVERGFYTPQVRRLLDHFRRDQVFFALSDDLRLNTASILWQIQCFLGVEPQALPAIRRSPVDTSPLGEIELSERDFLTDLYRSDIKELAELTGLACLHWGLKAYCES